MKLQEGSNKIIVLSTNSSITEVTVLEKMHSRLEKEVVVFGNQNSDGYMTAQNIQLNPEQMRVMISP